MHSHLHQPGRIGVLGRLESAAEQTEFLTLLASTEGKVELLELDFYDADTLPPSIIDALVRRLDGGASLKIIAYRPLLVHGLLRLGLPVLHARGQSPVAPLPPCRALVLAGSAQSLDKILHIVSHLPISQTTVFVAQHVPENQENLLDRLLRTRTDYAVVMPQHMTPVAPATIYVAPPGHHMKVAHGLVYLTRDRPVQFARPSIDVLFKSVADEYRHQVLAVLLCGFGEDGVAGCAALKEVGACVIVENSQECGEASVLPDAARKAGHYDHVIGCAGIASIAAAAVSGPQAAPSGALLDLFLETLRRQYDYDFRGYQRDSLERRIRHLMQQFGLPEFVDFQRAILSHRPLFDRMVAEISVSVTEFFRHPTQFRELRETVFPYLASFPVLKVWSAGCATGEEAYSLAILLDELGLLSRSRLFATDINHYLLSLAANGLFPSTSMELSRNNYQAAGGPQSFDAHVEHCGRYLKIRDHLRKAVLFYRHTLVDEGVFNEFQLIVCRNVLIPDCPLAIFQPMNDRWS